MYDPHMVTPSAPSGSGRHAGTPLRPRSLLGTLTTPVSGSTGTNIALVGLVLVLVAGFVVVLLAGKNVVPYVAFASGPVVASIIGALLSKRAQLLAADMAQVKTATNGQMTQAFEAAADDRAANESARAAAAHAIISRIDQLPIVVSPQGNPPSAN